jgi:hypothetical protein
MRTLDDVDHFDTASRELWEVTINSIMSFFSLLVITDVHVKAWGYLFYTFLGNFDDSVRCGMNGEMVIISR